MNVAILPIASECNRVAGVFQAEEVKTSHAAHVARLNADSNGIVSLFVDNNIVATSQGKRLNEVTGKILVIRKQDRGFRWVNVEELVIKLDKSQLFAHGSLPPLSCQRSGYHDLQARCQ